MGGITSYQTARSSIEQPRNPDFLDVITWVLSGSDISALMAAVVAGAGTLATFYQLAFDDPYTAKQGRGDRKHQNASFKVLDKRNDARSGQIIEVVRRDKHEQALADLIAGRAEEKLRRRYERALGLKRFDGSELSNRQAGEIAIAAQEAENSSDPASRQIARLVDEGKIVEAASLKAELAQKILQQQKESAAAAFESAGYLALPFDPNKAAEHFAEAIRQSDHMVWSRIQLSRILYSKGRLSEAKKLLVEAVPSATDPFEKTALYNGLGTLALESQNFDEAERLYTKGLDFVEKQIEANPDDPDLKFELAISDSKLGELSSLRGDFDKAELHHRRSAETSRLLLSEHGENPVIARGYSIDLMRLGQVHLTRAGVHFQNEDDDAGRKEIFRAREPLEKALELRRNLVRSYPDEWRYKRDLSVVLLSLGALDHTIGELDAAKEKITEASELDEQLLDADPDNAVWHIAAIRSRALLAGVAIDPTDYANALPIVQGLQDELKEFNVSHPEFALIEKDIRDIQTSIDLLRKKIASAKS